MKIIDRKLAVRLLNEWASERSTQINEKFDGLGSFRSVLHEDELPIAWGHEILRHLGEEKFAALRQYGKPEVIERGWNCKWALVTVALDPPTAVKLLGRVTDLELGPRGGYRSVTYGVMKFYSRQLDPRKFELETEEIEIVGGGAVGVP